MHQINLNQQKPKHVVLYASPSRTPLSSIDRISTLPNDILHYILTLLDTKNCARTSVLSKRFNSLWWSFPRIDINANHHLDVYSSIYGGGPDPMKKFLDHMKLCYMRHELKFVEKLRIIPVDEIDGVDEELSPLVDSFVFAAIEGGALKEIELRFWTLIGPPFDDEDELEGFHVSLYKIPQVPLFESCKTLTSLILEACSFDQKFMLLNIELPYVKKISLRTCDIRPYNFLAKLINGCPELEDLSVQFCACRGVTIFSHSKLKNLILMGNDSLVILQVHVPNLITFVFGAIYLTFLLYYSESEAILNKESYINAPNLEFFCVRTAYLTSSTIQMALTTFKNLKEMVLSHCRMEKCPEFLAGKIEKLVISSCAFGEGGLMMFYESNLPVLRSLNISLCEGIQWLDIASTKLEELVLKRLIIKLQWDIWAPNLSISDCCIDLRH